MKSVVIILSVMAMCLTALAEPKDSDMKRMEEEKQQSNEFVGEESKFRSEFGFPSICAGEVIDAVEAKIDLEEKIELGELSKSSVAAARANMEDQAERAAISCRMARRSELLNPLGSGISKRVIRKNNKKADEAREAALKIYRLMTNRL